MKTQMKKIGLGMTVLLTTTLIFSSFMSGPSKSSRGKEELDENSRIWEFTTKTICDPLRVGLKGEHPKVDKKDFSRCPSGYYPQFATDDKEMRTANFVFGTIAFERGCNSNYVCNFKVCVDKGYAMIRSANSKEYIPVSTWLKSRKEAKVVKL